MIGVLLGCFLIGVLLTSSVVGACCYCYSYNSKQKEYMVDDYIGYNSAYDDV